MNQKLFEILNGIKQSRVLVVGDAILDCTVNGEFSGMSAEAPISTFRQRGVCYALGGACNVASNLICAGQQVTLVSVLGNDDNGKIVTNLLAERGIVNEIVVDESRITTEKKRFYVNGKQIFRCDHEDDCDVSSDVEQKLFEKITKTISCVDIVVLSDYLKGCLTKSLIKNSVSLAKQHGLKVVVDPKDSDYTKYADCDVIKPNKKELAKMMGNALTDESDVVNCCKALCKSNNHQAVITTLGDDGMIAYDNKQIVQVPAIQTNAVDVVGAGDTAISYLAVGVASGMDLPSTVALANTAAGAKVCKHGTTPISCQDLFQTDKLVPYNQVEYLRKSLLNNKVVFTNGCFDLLHAGHVHCLQQAKNCGDVLVVGVNSDSSVARLKGNNRPIIPLQERIKMLCALSCVDYVVPFDQDTPLELIRLLQPQVLVKGAEYQNKTVVGADVVTDNGGQVRFANNYDGFSTSQIVEKIKKCNE